MVADGLGEARSPALKKTLRMMVTVSSAPRTGGGDRPPLRVQEESIDSPPGVISALTVGHAVRQSAHFGQDLSSSCHRARFDVNLRRQA